jgi:hypothetical protein
MNDIGVVLQDSKAAFVLNTMTRLTGFKTRRFVLYPSMLINKTALLMNCMNSFPGTQPVSFDRSSLGSLRTKEYVGKSMSLA